MTRKQSYALFCKTGIDIRDCELSVADIDKAFAIPADDARTYLETFTGAVARRELRKRTDVDKFTEIYNDAHTAGTIAAAECTPVPMVVQEHENMMDDSSPVVKQYYVADGVCGFAWINVRNGNSSFCRWLKKTEKGHTDSYYGGVSIWVHDFGQSMTRKQSYAHAFTRVLNDNGIKARSMSRMD